MKKILILFIFLLINSCNSIQTPLQIDLIDHKQHSSSLISKIENSKELVKKNPTLIKNTLIRSRFLEIEAENHSKQICAVTSYYLLLKYSGVENLGSFEEYYIREINKGSIIETISKEIPSGFALIPGRSAVNLLLRDYKYKKKKFKIQTYQDSTGLDKFKKSNSSYAIVGKIRENYSHYFLIFKDKQNDIRIADASNLSSYNEILESKINTILWLEF